jgi:hypothetical protein
MGFQSPKGYVANTISLNQAALPCKWLRSGKVGRRPPLAFSRSALTQSPIRRSPDDVLVFPFVGGLLRIVRMMEETRGAGGSRGKRVSQRDR